MIPLKISLKNFLSYGPKTQDVEFYKYRLICLSGKNGHGKSALLDAITWAIWGQARKTISTVKPDKDLVHLGQTQMSVIFEFEIDSQVYRIKREFALTYGKPYASLDIALLKKNELTILSAKTIKETQKIIEKIIGLDFEGFCNSAFLRQGQSNEFSQKSPKERKEILGKILGLEKYEKTKKLALEKARTQQAEGKTFAKLKERLEQEIDNYKILTQSAKELVSSLSQEQKTELEINQKLLIVRNEQNELYKKQKEYEHINIEIQRNLNSKSELYEQLKETKAHWSAIHKAFLTLSTQSNLEEKKEKIKKQIKDIQETHQTRLILKEKLLSAKELLQNIEAKIEREFDVNTKENNKELERLRTVQTKLITEKNSIDKQKNIISIELEAVEEKIKDKKNQKQNFNLQEKIDTIQKQFERRKEFYQKYISQGKFIQQDINKINDKKSVYLFADNPNCPLCEQLVSASRKRFLLKKIQKDEQFKKHRINRLFKITQELKKVLYEQHAFLQKLIKQDEEKKILNVEYKELITNQQKQKVKLDQITSEEIKLNKEIKNQSEKINQYELCILKEIENKKNKKEKNVDYIKTKSNLEVLKEEIDKKSYNQKEQEEKEKELDKINNQIMLHIKKTEKQKIKNQYKKTILSLIEQIKQQKILIKTL